MRRWLLLLPLVALAVGLRPQAGAACGFRPFTDEAGGHPEALRALLVGERLPLLGRGWRSEYWVLVWARARGRTFDAAEIAALEAQGTLGRRRPDIDGAVEEWWVTRATTGAGLAALPRPRPWRRGDGFAYALVCAPDAFRTAAATLLARRDVVSPDALRRWVEAQDRVFARCAEPDAPLPPPLLGDVPPLLRHDRAYQRAAAVAYGASPAEAEPLFEAIAASDSPFADIARYRVAYLRHQRGAATVDDIDRRLGETRDRKARRALVQLRDRVGLYAATAPGAIVTALGERLLAGSQGEDLPRVIGDMVHFARRVPLERCSTGLVELLRGVGPCRSADSDPDGQLARLRWWLPDRLWESRLRPAQLPGPLFELQRHHDAAEAALRRGQLARARREASALLRLAGNSTAATRNAASALALATARSDAEAFRHLLRFSAEHGAAPRVLHADGRRALARMSMDRWLELLPALAPPVAVELAEDGLVRALLLGDEVKLRRFARVLAGWDDGYRSALEGSLEEPGARLRQAALRLVVTEGVGDFHVRDELEGDGDAQTRGCRRGGCEVSRPTHTTASLVGVAGAPFPTSPERRRVLSHESLLDGIGELLLELAARHPGDPAMAELLHHFVGRTRSAALRRRGSGLRVSRQAFVLLHEQFGETQWAARTRYWY